MVEGSKPKQQRQKPVDKQSNLNLTEVADTKFPVVTQQELGHSRLYRSQSFFTRKQISRAERKAKNKTQRKSRQINRLVAAGKR